MLFEWFWVLKRDFVLCPFVSVMKQLALNMAGANIQGYIGAFYVW